MNDYFIVSCCQNRLASWAHGFNGNASTTLLVDSQNNLIADLAKIKPKVLLLDIDLLGSNGVIDLRSICVNTKTIIMIGGISEDMEWDFLKVGIKGICRYDIAHNLLLQAVIAVQKGELWIRRSLASRMLDELHKAASKDDDNRVSIGLKHKLSNREYDIALHVVNGESNKKIAQLCGITERTVKAHLTVIYQKMHISDRINLALILSRENQNNGLDNMNAYLGNKYDLSRTTYVGHTIH
jgi:DNA-binding NarL/FixJ family response regulator